MSNICVFGDSIAWGAFDKEKGGWVNRLRLFFDSKFDGEIHLYNLGVSGENTEKLLKRFKDECRAREANIIIFAIGINDAQYIDTPDNPRVSKNNFNKNLRELFDQAKVFSEKIIFVGLTKVDEKKMMPIPWDANKYYQNNIIKLYDKAIEEICIEKKLLYISLFDLLGKEDLSDGLHPNAEGHRKIFERIKEQIIELV
jgi:lysophospholipase L1-like esterase